MKISRFAVAALAMAFSIGAAQAVSVHRTVTVKGNPTWVWLDIGNDFCEIEDWLPIINNCDDYEEDDVTYRTLTTPDGATVKEKLLEETDTSYSYAIIESPLPVANYNATFSVSAGGDGTVIDWYANFDAYGASDAEAAAVIAGIFEAGLNQIVSDYAD